MVTAAEPEWTVTVMDGCIDARRRLSEQETEILSRPLSPQDTSRALRQWANAAGATITPAAMTAAMQQVAALAADALAAYPLDAIIP